MIQAFCTDRKPPAERADYWTDAVGKAFIRLEVHTQAETKIHGTIRQACVAGVQVGSLDASPQRMVRSASLIAADGDDSLVVSLQRTGYGIATQDGRETPVAAGQLVILDTRRPYVLDYTCPVRQHVATVPRQLVELPDSALRLATGRTYPRATESAESSPRTSTDSSRSRTAASAHRTTATSHRPPRSSSGRGSSMC